MYSSPKLLGYASFSGLHFAANSFLEPLKSVDFEDRLRVHIAAYNLGTAMISYYVERNHSWPHDEFLEQFSSGMVNSPSFIDGDTTLDDLLVYSTERNDFAKYLSERTAKSAESLTGKVRESRNLYHVLIQPRNRAYADALETSYRKTNSEIDAFIHAGLFCTSAWIWGAAPSSAETMKSGRAFFERISDWMMNRILPVIQREDDTP